MPGTIASETPSVSLSFANNFWGKEDAGVSPLLERMHNAKVTGDELKAFYGARAQIEDEYARKLLNLARKPFGSSEAGTLRMSFDVVRGEVESMGKTHQGIAGQMKSELEEPLGAFTGGMKERRKIVQSGIEKLHKTKTQQTQAVNKARDRYEQDCLKIKGYLAQGHMVMGQEERKNKAKLEKTQIQLSSTSNEYEAAVKVLEETTGRWNREWKAACDKFQDLEEERLDFMKSSLWSFANIASTVCVSDDASCEKVRLSLEDCDVEKDITGFIKEQGTGQEIPDPPKFINFCRGDINDAASDVASDDGAYSVAQFQRTMNPAFRSSSPQPSMLSSRHGGDSSLVQDTGRGSLPPDDLDLGRIPSHTTDPLRSSINQRPSFQQDDPLRSSLSSRPSIQQEDAFRTSQSRRPVQQDNGFRDSQAQRPIPQDDSSRGSQNQRPIHPDDAFRGSQSQRPEQHDPYADMPKVPHNEYPTDGMTQFCRIGPPSERSSQPSPTRPESRDTASEYSNPTSYSSYEPASGHQSPVKHFNDSTVSSQGATDQEIQKKRSGFFPNKSPFRRKSKHEGSAVTSPVLPSTRNTWSAPSGRNSFVQPSSPTRPPGREARNVGFGSDGPEPDPVDPRANFQLNVGNNVFDVAPESRRRPSPQKGSASGELDPIAQALADLKGVTKQSSVRMSADRYHGIATPAQSGTPGPGDRGHPGAAFRNQDVRAAQRGTPPPQYDQQPVSRLGAPQPAFTSKQMQQTTASYMTQKRDMFDAPNRGPQQPRSQSAMSGRQGARDGHGPDVRSASPAPLRNRSPQPYMEDPRRQPPFRAASPNPYGGPPNNGQQNRARAQSTSPIKSPNGYGGFDPRDPRGPSPNHMQRAASPQPHFGGNPNQSGSRPLSTGRGSDLGAPGRQMQIASPAQGQSRGPLRPTSQVYGDSGPYSAVSNAPSPNQMASRPRTQSVAGQRQVTKEGRPILHHARALYMYQAAIPEELSFAKGEILAVLRHQDDGWWEAEVAGKNGRPGLVPSNYLQNC